MYDNFLIILNVIRAIYIQRGDLTLRNNLFNLFIIRNFFSVYIFSINLN